MIKVNKFTFENIENHKTHVAIYTASDPPMVRQKIN